MSLVPTRAQLRAQVAAVLDKSLYSKVIGIRMPASADVGDSLLVNGREIPLARCASVLEIRERLAAAVPDEPLVLLTSLMEPELGADVVARLARHHLFTIEPWLLVRERFKARHVDPRLVQRHPWVARALLDAEPAEGYAPAPSGFLEAELVWRVLFESLLGLPRGERDALALLQWSADADTRRGGEHVDPEILALLADAVADSAGPLARRIFDCSTGPNGEQAVAAGLVARVLYGPEAKGHDISTKASGKLEAWLGAGELGSDIALAWADAAEVVIRRGLVAGGMKRVQALLDHADALLTELGAGDTAHRSNLLQAGLAQRIDRFADGLQAFVKGRAKRVPTTVAESADAVRNHALAVFEPQRQRVDRIEMALRLARWLAAERQTGPAPAPSFIAAAAAYRGVGGFVDWARTGIREGDSSPALAAAYALLYREARRVREAQNQRFGELLANWLKTGSHDTRVIPVEDVLSRVVVPVAKLRPTLLVVVDGMGMAVFRELEADLARQGWAEVDRAEDSLQLPVIAALPSVTEVSRTSLLSGKLVTGQSANEKSAFAAQPQLVAVSEPGRPAILYHKADLTESGEVGVPAAVFNAIDDLHRRVVGVVINAVDDHLAKGDQLRVAWRIHTIRPLEELLAAARAAGRAVILVSDHGHVLEHDTTSTQQAVGERWRDDTATAGAAEVLLEGPRVLLGDGRVVAPWSEAVRLGMKKNGYHGGAAPQEVVIPLGVFVHPGAVPAGWNEVALDSPDWWDEIVPRAPAPRAKPEVIKPLAPAKPNEQGQLFGGEDANAAPQAGPRWIERLLVSELMQMQRQAAARTQLSDDRIRDVLAALDERGGKLTRTALAKRLGIPLMRVGGVLSALRRVLNVDGYDVLSVEEASDTVMLNREFLDAQFGIRE